MPPNRAIASSKRGTPADQLPEVSQLPEPTVVFQVVSVPADGICQTLTESIQKCDSKGPVTSPAQPPTPWLRSRYMLEASAIAAASVTVCRSESFT